MKSTGAKSLSRAIQALCVFGANYVGGFGRCGGSSDDEKDFDFLLNEQLERFYLNNLARTVLPLDQTTSMSLERTGSIDSGSSWGDEYEGGIVNPAGSSYPSQEPEDEITVERLDDVNESTFPSHQEISFGSSVSWCCLKNLYKVVFKIRSE